MQRLTERRRPSTSSSPTAVRIGSERELIGSELAAHMAPSLPPEHQPQDAAHAWLATAVHKTTHSQIVFAGMRRRPNYPEPVQRLCGIAKYRHSKSSAIMLQSCVYWHVQTLLRAILPCCDSSDRLHMECGSREPSLVLVGVGVRSRAPAALWHSCKGITDSQFAHLLAWRSAIVRRIGEGNIAERPRGLASLSQRCFAHKKHERPGDGNYYRSVVGGVPARARVQLSGLYCS
jgi:hypothetical protein